MERARSQRSEAATAHVLTELRGRGWTVIHDVAWPGRELANVTHVVVGPAGVFVIESLSWSGRITTVGGVLLRNGRQQPKTTRGAHAAAVSIGHLLPSVSQQHVVPVLCFLDGDVPDVVVDGVLVCSIVTVVHRLTLGQTVFGDDEVEAVAAELRRSLPAGSDPRPAPLATFASRSQRRRIPRTLVTVVAGLALAAALATNPGSFLALTNGITGLVTDQLAPAEDVPTPPPAKPNNPKQKTPAKQR